MKNKLLSTALVISGLLLSAAGYAEPVYAVGSYDVGREEMPSLLMAESNDNGITWNNGLTNKQKTGGVLFSSSCSSDSCVAVGGQNTKKGAIIPVIYHKNKSDKNWQLTKFEGQSSMSFFVKAYCQDNNCYAIGMNVDTMSQTLASSSDEGRNWAFVKKIDDKPIAQVLKKVEADHMACNTSFCIVIGNKKNEKIEKASFPIILTTGKDNQWSTRSLKLSDEVVLNSVACDEEFCMLVGTKNDSEPFIATTNDEGKNWHFPITMANGKLNEMSCSDKVCLAVGTFEDTESAERRPLLLKSTDSGNTWQSQASVFDNDIITKYPNINVESVNCHHQRCVIVGSYENETKNDAPFLMISHDAAQTWEFPEEIYNQYPKDFTEGKLSTIVCSDNACTAAGSHEFSERYGSDALFIVLDTNSGLWSYSEINKENMPQNYKSSNVFSIAR